ncbi:MAG: glycogen debranching protein GlgX [Nocardioides sp.]
MRSAQWSSLGEQAEVWPGRMEPLGATWRTEATNFAVFAPRATDCWVCLIDDEGTETQHRLSEQTLGIWHGALPGIAPGTRYGFRLDGPWEPDSGARFNPRKLLLDPYARAVSGGLQSNPAIYGYDFDDREQPSLLDSAPYVPLGVVVGPDDFDWGNDTPSRQRWRDTVIYELHVKGMTALHDRVPAELRGTYAGLATPAVVDYLRDLGITAVELLPVHQHVPEPTVSDRGLTNYWGYNTIAYLAPHHAYAATGDRGEQVTEFKAMVKAFHDAGIEVFLDVVYNHTAEGGPLGPTLSMRGLDDRGFYTRVDPEDPDSDVYWDATGCGNTVDADNPFALRLILDSLRYWVTEMHVDGFRFDLLSALTRVDHEIDMRCHLMTAIGQDPILRGVKLIAEPWDATMDGYLVGNCPPPWVEWNDQFRDELRDFWRGHSSGIRTVATRLAGSSDLYADDGRSPYASVNFVTAHDGFTVRDLVSYDRKHNEANGEDNRDGTDNNRSDNHGVEGETDDADIIARRRRTAANVMATLCLANGVPMITAGDERGRTQLGNNNAYCQDNEISWIDWRADGEPGAWLDVYETTRAALALRRAHPALRQRHWFEGSPTIADGPKDLTWLHPSGREMTEDDWHDSSLSTVAMWVLGNPLRSPGPRGEQQVDSSFALWFNSDADPVDVVLPENPWVQSGEVVLSTDPDLAVGTVVHGGDTVQLSGPCVVVLREVRP